jgi:uncharacterized protein YneF (UPF0154 family)
MAETFDPSAQADSIAIAMILLLISLALGFAGGFYAGVKNANSSKVAKAKSLADEFVNK